MADPARSPVEWLLASDEPAIRGMARRDLLHEADPPELQRVMEGPIVRALLSGQRTDGGSRRRPDGVVLSDASMEGNALAVACRLGQAGDRRAQQLAESLIAWQWPDGGWNCDRRASGRRSSFHETHAPMWALFEYARATGSVDAAAAADRACELFLSHRLFRRGGSGDPIHRSWTTIHYPPYWHYDVLQALHLLARMGRVRDERAVDALDLLEQRQLPDGRWRAGAYWWQPPGSLRAAEVVDWRRGMPSEMITLNAMRVLRSAGRA
jgi:hypothetical protein